MGYWSLSSRRAWIEIVCLAKSFMSACVALLTESVDWNVYQSAFWHLWFWVALLTESVDWNVLIRPIGMTTIRRSPHGERGLKYCMIFNRSILWSWSLSSRRAWIEMDLIQSGLTYPLQVALLTESVDWNNKSSYLFIKHCMSLSSRRAWIEIKKTGVSIHSSICRSPHGERGLKFWYALEFLHHRSVALLTESVDWNVSVAYNIFSPFSRSPHGERGLK